MESFRLELYWNEIPIGKANAITYDELKVKWHMSDRRVRAILHRLSNYDNGDDYILIRSAKGKGFYKTDDPQEMKDFRQECLNKGRSVFAPVKKINRVMKLDAEQFQLENNMRLHREAAGMTQAETCARLQAFDKAIDKAMLSKMENGVCLPTPYQLAVLADIYECSTSDLLDGDIFL